MLSDITREVRNFLLCLILPRFFSKLFWTFRPTKNYRNPLLYWLPSCTNTEFLTLTLTPVYQNNVLKQEWRTQYGTTWTVPCHCNLGSFYCSIFLFSSHKSSDRVGFHSIYTCTGWWAFDTFAEDSPSTLVSGYRVLRDLVIVSPQQLILQRVL